MRLTLLSALLALPALAMAESDTAYKALRIFGKQQGEKLLNRVVELRGRNGVPQPQVWKVTSSDPAARGGLTEVDVQRGSIIAQRTPTAKPGGPGAPMDLNRLNLDSDGAFTVADKEMQAHTIPFDRVDYLLRCAAPGEAPIWHLDLYDRGSKVANMRIAADTGTIIDQEHFVPSGTAHSTNRDRDRDYVDEGRPSHRTESDGRFSKPGEPFRDVGDFFHRLGKRFERRGAQLKNFFTGDHDDRGDR
jgi:hypothetical protein